MRVYRRRTSCLTILLPFVLGVSAFAHVRVTPREAAAGATQRYTMSVPTERDSPTVRLEMEFPGAVTVISFVEAPGWKIEQKKDGKGKIVAATWSGGSIPFAESAQFHFDAKNPDSDVKLEWRVVQIYADGSRSEWTGPEGSRTPSSVTLVKKAAPNVQ